MDEQRTFLRMPSKAVRIHAIIVGLAIWVIGAVVRWLVPDFSVVWVGLAVIAVAHLGLIVAVGSWILDRVAGREGDATQ